MILAAYTAVVLALTLLPVPESVGGLFPKWFDKVVHLGLFSTLAALIYWDRFSTGRPSRMGAVLPAIVLAGVIELAQGPLPRRSGDVWDFVLGVVGAVTGLMVAQWVLPHLLLAQGDDRLEPRGPQGRNPAGEERDAHK